MKTLFCAVLFVAGSLALPASQPAYTGQYVTAQAIQPQHYQPQYQIQYQPQTEYRQVSQAEFLAAYAQPTQAPQVHEAQPEAQVQYAPQQYRNTQPLLGTVERQVWNLAKSLISLSPRHEPLQDPFSSWWRNNLRIYPFLPAFFSLCITSRPRLAFLGT